MIDRGHTGFPRVAAGALAAWLVAGYTVATGAWAADAALARRTEESRHIVEQYAALRRGNPEQAWQRFLAANAIQHNPEIPEGRAAHQKFLAARRAAHPADYVAPEQYVNVIDNILADGDLVAIKSRLYTSSHDTGRAFVDIWRVRHGRLVEHWDVIQPVPLPTLNTASMGCGDVGSYAQGLLAGDTAAHPTCGSAGERAHREAALATVMDYLALGQRPGQQTEAVQRYVADDFVQHSPHIAPGKAGLAGYLAARAAAGGMQGRVSHIGRVLADGDFVLVHRRVTTAADPRGTAYADLFRVRDRKIAEHWDVIQSIPPYSVNGRAMVSGPLEPGRRIGPKSE